MVEQKQRLSDEAIEAMFEAQTAIIAPLIEELERSGRLEEKRLPLQGGQLDRRLC